MVVILGLTGSIAMGKSTAALFFRRLGVPVWDADAAVHRLYSTDKALVAAVEAAFSGTTKAGEIDRDALGRAVLGNPDALARLEAIVHPVVARDRTRFLLAAARRRETLVVLDVPLLFETGMDRACDGVAVVSAPAFVQRYRVLVRPGMTQDRLEALRARQMPDAEKRLRADVVIATGLGRDHHFRQIRVLMRDARRLHPGVWGPAFNM